MVDPNLQNNPEQRAYRYATRNIPRSFTNSSTNEGFINPNNKEEYLISYIKHLEDELAKTRAMLQSTIADGIISHGVKWL